MSQGNNSFGISSLRLTSYQTARRSTYLNLRDSLVLFFGTFVCTLCLAQTSVAFPGATSVGQNSSPLLVMVNLSGSGIAAAPEVLTQGLAGVDFSIVDMGSCVANSTFTADSQCALTVLFRPIHPGLRRGAVVIRSVDGRLMGSAQISGTAKGPLAVLTPGEINTVAGNAGWIFNGDGVPATQASLFLPMGIATDAGGNIYISDSSNNRVRRVDKNSGLISTIAGNGNPGYAGDQGPATSAMVSMPAGIALDGAGNIYFADTGNQIVRRVDAISGVITTVAGIPALQGSSGDGGAATLARLSLPQGVAFDADGDLLIVDTGNNTVREVSAVTGIISTIAGTGTAGYNGDNVLATKSALNGPWGVCAGVDGTLYIADLYNNRVRAVSPTGIIRTVAGNGAQSFTGDGGVATLAALNEPAAVAVDPAGDIFIADSGNDRVREVSVVTGQISTILGSDSQQFLGDRGPANLAALYGPYALFLDEDGNLFLSDMFHNRVREVSASLVAYQYPEMRVGKTSAPQVTGLTNEGNGNLLISSYGFVNTALDSVTTTCSIGTSQLPGIPCTLGVEFAPTVIGAPVLGTLTVNSNSLAPQPVVDVSGQVLTTNPTSVALSSSMNPSQFDGAVTFTAVLSGGDNMSGTVTFTDGSGQLCSVSPVNDSASCTTSQLSLGQHSIVASYSGDSADAASTSAALIQIVKQEADLVLTASPNPAMVNASVTLTLTATAPMGTPTGSIIFYDGATAIGSANLGAGGVASFSTTQLSPGMHSISAQYSGDAHTATASSNSVSETVQQAETTTTLATSAATVAVGTTLIFSANIAGSHGTTPTGSVQFLDGTTQLGSGMVNVNDVATLQTSSLTPGTHKILAVYGGDANDMTSSSVALIQTVTQLGTTTSVTADVNPASAGAAIHFTATVAIAAGATADGPLDGNVSFTDGSSSLGTATINASGQATLTVSTFAVGIHAITASYAGDTNYAMSSSPALGEVVTTTSTTTSISASVATIYAGQVETLSAGVVSSSGGAPSGTVTFMEGSVALGQTLLNSQGSTMLNLSSLAVGSHVITAVYGGDGTYLVSTSPAVTVLVKQATTSTSLATSTNPTVLGQGLTLSAIVTSITVNPAGSVSFMDGTNLLASVAVGAGGTATYSTNGLGFGPHTLTAVYAGDIVHAASTSVAVKEQVVQGALETLTASVNPAIAGVGITFTATVSSVNGITPSGQITFRDGSVTIGAAAVASGVASFRTSLLSVGSHMIAADYSGDANYAPAIAILAETIQSADTLITLTASANPAIYATPLIFTTIIASNGGVATGQVSFTDAATVLGTGTINAAGMATLTTASLTPGPHSIVANYGGDGNASGSASTPLVVVVKETTQSSLTSNANPAQTLSAITLTSVVANSGIGVPTGNVLFADGSTMLGTVALDRSGVATLTVPSWAAGIHNLTASYLGDGSNFSSTTALMQTVTLRPTGTSITATPTNPSNPQQVMLIAVVDSSGTPTATGTVTFTTGSTTLGTAPVGSTGVATLPLILRAMSEIIVASYSGDPSYASSISHPTTIVGGTSTQFTVDLKPSSATLASKQHTTITLTLSSKNNFADELNLGCLGLSYATTCTFSSAQVNLAANGVQTVQITIDTGDPLGSASQAATPSMGPSSVMMCLLPVGGMLVFGLRRRQTLLAIVGLIAISFLTLTESGCSGLTVNGTPAGTYVFSVGATGKATGVSQYSVFTLTVTQ